MFAEIFLFQLEIAVRLADRASGPAAPRFVPLPPGMRPKFKLRLVAI
jgi:hypothetical protein